MRDLHDWTLNLPESGTLEDYQYRLKVARASLKISVEETMVAVASQKRSVQARYPISLTSAVPIEPQEKITVLKSEQKGDSETVKPAPTDE